MSVHVIRLCLALLLAAALFPRAAPASEIPDVASAHALASQGARAAYGITLITTGLAMLPITTESIIAGHIESAQAPGTLVTAALLGLGGIPLLAAAAKPLSADSLAGACRFTPTASPSNPPCCR